MNFQQACQYAQSMVNYYIQELPDTSEYLYIRTCNMFLSIIFDEIGIFFKNKTQSTLKSNTEYGICKLVSDIFTDFIQPMYSTLLLHKPDKNTTHNITKPISQKKVIINTDKNEVFLLKEYVE